MKKFALLSAVMAAMMFAASNASAVMGVFSLTATVETQGTVTNKSGTEPVIKKQSFSQNNLLFILEQGTGDTSITNKHVTTKIYYDPDALNTNATIWAEGQGGSGNIFGIFYYSNSVSGLVPLDGVNGGQYYSYMELDFFNSFDGFLGFTEGFWNPGAMEFNSVAGVTSSSFTEDGNAIFYVHEEKLAFNLLGNWNQGDSSAFYLANDWNGPYSAYALVIHGTITFKISVSQSKNVETESESFSLKGSGDGIFNDIDGVVTGTATFTGKGPDDLF